jgi:hypothetical protein
MNKARVASGASGAPGFALCHNRPYTMVPFNCNVVYTPQRPGTPTAINVDMEPMKEALLRN